MGTTALSKVGARRLAAAEAKIERGLATFIEVGEALVSIRDERLYRAEHDTFEAYCKSRWGFTDRRARQLIDAARIGTVVPVSNEAQARPLTSLDGPDEVREVYAAAEAEGDTTAAGLTRAVKRRKATTTSTTETVTFDKEDGFVAQPAEGGADEDSSASKGRTETPASPSVPPVDPTLGYRAAATRARSTVRSHLLTLDPERVIETSDDRKAWGDFSHDVRSWLDALDEQLAGVRLKAVP